MSSTPEGCAPAAYTLRRATGPFTHLPSVKALLFDQACQDSLENRSLSPLDCALSKQADDHQTITANKLGAHIEPWQGMFNQIAVLIVVWEMTRKQ